MRGEERAKNLWEWRVIVNVKSNGIAKKSEKINMEDSRERREGRVRKAATEIRSKRGHPFTRHFKRIFNFTILIFKF